VFEFIFFSRAFFADSPGHEEVVTGEGMPINPVAPSGKRFEQINEDVASRGNLILRFTIEFPENLTERQKKLISQADL
jgi:DnaJ-class molecular chaperone